MNCDTEFTKEGTGRDEREAMGDMVLKALESGPTNCPCLKLLSRLLFKDETPVRASGRFIWESKP